MILVRSNRFPLDRKPLRHLCRRFLDNRGPLLIQQRFAVFHWQHKMIVDWPRTVCSLTKLIVPLIHHAPEGTRKDCPRSKLRRITN